jgi:hypothetical protein
LRLVDPDVLDDAQHFFDWDAHYAAKASIPAAPPPDRGPGFWTDERVAILSRHFIDGRHTESIARLLKTTKRAVIGKADRLGLVHGSHYLRRKH